MTSESNSWPAWESLSSTFRDSYKSIDQNVYRTAGAIWLRAVRFARGNDSDESTAYSAMMKAISNVSTSTHRREIQRLENYLFTAYKHCLFEEIRKSGKVDSDTEGLDRIAIHIDSTAQIEAKILLEEIVSRMDPQILEIYEALILGYSFEELAREKGLKANALRSRFSKAIKRISRTLNLGPVKLTG